MLAAQHKGCAQWPKAQCNSYRARLTVAAREALVQAIHAWLDHRTKKTTTIAALEETTVGKLFVAEHEDRFLASVNNVKEDIDVFVSHKSEDEGQAIEVAVCLNTMGLTAWVDAIDMEGVEDDTRMVRRIEDAISRASSLIAVVTEVTNESWWVPFEIGLAYEKEKQLASYCEDACQVNLPSFLWSWPVIKDHFDLHEWCEHYKSFAYSIVAEALKARVGRRQTYRDNLIDIRDQLRK